MGNVPPFLQPLYSGDRALCDEVMADLAEIHAPAGAVPLKYRILMSLVADAVLNHPEGVTALARQARVAGATDEEMRETLRLIYVTGGIVALLNCLGACGPAAGA